MKKILKTDSEWKKALSKQAYEITRKSGTERPFTNHDFPNQEGEFNCICCDTPLFASKTKYESRSGWPSFFDTLKNGAIVEKQDNSFSMSRTEVSCSICDAHLGHVFPDGPLPTKLRYCINGFALRFKKTSKTNL